MELGVVGLMVGELFDGWNVGFAVGLTVGFGSCTVGCNVGCGKKFLSIK